jgi:hypothetical protein
VTSEAPVLKPVHILKNVNDDKSVVLHGISFPHLFSACIVTFVRLLYLDYT